MLRLTSPLARSALFSLLALTPVAHAFAQTPSEPPEPTPDAGTPDAGPVLVPPQLLEATAPEIPDTAWDALEVTSMVLELTLDAEGHVTDAQVLEGTNLPEVDQLVLSAAALLRFSPATADGVAIPAIIAFRFELSGGPEEPEAPVEPAVSPSEPAAAPPPVQETAADEDDIAEIDVEVRGEAPPREATRHAIEGVEIRRIPGTNGDAIRAIETMPGVARPAGFEGMLIVRGSAPEDTQVFVDGALIPQAYHFGGISSVVPAEILERLEFRPGNFGPEFGRGMGGVVDLGVRSPRREGYGGMVQVDLLDARFIVEGALTDRTRFLLAGRRSWVDAWLGRVLSGGGTQVRTAPVYYDWQAILEHDITRRTTARLMFIGADDRLSLLLASPDSQDPAFGGSVSAHSGFTRLQLRLDSRITDDVRWTSSVTWGTEKLGFFVGDNFADVSMHTLQGRSEVRANLGEYVSLTGGVDVLWQRTDVSLRLTPYPAADEPPGPTFGRPPLTVEAQPSAARPGAYLHLDITPFDGLRLMPGIRVDYTQDNGGVTVDPRFAARWDVHPGAHRTTLKGAVGLYHQPPQPIESMLDTSFTVRSPRALHASLGVEQQLTPHFELSIEGFWKDFDDLTVARASDTDTVIGVRFENDGEGRAYGGELMLRYRPDGGPFFGWLAYTLSRSERRDGNSGPYHTMQYDQTHILSAVGSVDLGRGWSVGARFRYVTGSPTTPYVGGVFDSDGGAYSPVQEAGSFSARLASFHQLDLRVDKTWTFEAWRLTAYLDIRNTYNRQNAEGVSYNFDFSDSAPMAGLPIMPVVGVRGEL